MDDLETTIFGEESFFDKHMVKIYEATNKYVYDKFSSAIKVAMPQVEINEERLKRWINLCLKLENIEQSELIDMATQKRFLELKHKLEEKERQVSVYAKEIGFLDNRIKNLKDSCDYYMERANNLLIKSNNIAIEELKKLINFFNKPHLNGSGQRSVSISRLRKTINNQIKELNTN